MSLKKDNPDLISDSDTLNLDDASCPENTDVQDVNIDVTKLIRYSKDEILRFRTSPLAAPRPKIKDPIVDSTSCWLKPARNADEDGKQRRSGMDPRERTRKESDGIVLSPQRGNFNNGCAVAPQPVPPHRRIGSGRLLNRDWDGDEGQPGFRGRDDRSEYRNGGNQSEGDGRVGRQDYEGRSLWGKNNNENDGRFRNRYGDERRNHRHSNSRSNSETPEWFSGGPTSQNETIDLHGFDVSIDSDKDQKELDEIKDVDEPVMYADDETSQKVSEKKAGEDEDDVQPKQNTSFNFEDFLQNDMLAPLFSQNAESEASSRSSRFSQFFSEQGVKEELRGPMKGPDHHHLGPSAPDEAHQNMNGPNDDRTTTGTDLLEFFKREHPQPGQGPSLKDLAATGKVTSLEEIEAQMMRSANSRPSQPMMHPPPSMMSFLRRKEESQLRPAGDTGLNADVMNLMRHQEGIRMADGNRANNEFLAMLQRQEETKQVDSSNQLNPDVLMLMRRQEEGQRGANDIKSSTHPNPEVMAFLRRQEEEQEAYRRLVPSNLVTDPHIPGCAPPIGIPQELLYQLLHMQQVEERNRQIQMQQVRQIEFEQNMAQQMTTAPPPPPPVLPGDGFAAMPHDLHCMVSNTQPSHEVLSRPECISLVNGLKQGMITPQHLVNQLLKNPNMSPRQKESILTILHLVMIPGSNPPPPLHPVRDPVMLQQMLMSNGMPPQQRIIPSIDLMAHTANIMQGALIKKKLEEQLENFKKRQRESPVHASSARNDIPNGPSPTHSSTSLSFTPTSVLRKMIANEEKDASRKNYRTGAISVEIDSPLRSSSPRTQSRSPSSPIIVSPRSPNYMASHFGQPMMPHMRPIANVNGVHENIEWSPSTRNVVLRGNQSGAHQPAHLAYLHPIPLASQQLPNFRAPMPVPPQPGFPGQRMPTLGQSHIQQAPGSPQQDLSQLSNDMNVAWWTPEAMAQTQMTHSPGVIRPEHPAMISAEDLERRHIRPARF